MIPPTSIDGTDITGATIDGTDVQEITVDGDVVFTEQVSLPDNPIYAWDPATFSTSDSTWFDQVVNEPMSMGSGLTKTTFSDGTPAILGDGVDDEATAANRDVARNTMSLEFEFEHTTSGLARIIGNETQGTNLMNVFINRTGNFDSDVGRITFFISTSGGGNDSIGFSHNDGYNDGLKHKVSFVGNDFENQDVDMYVDGNQVTPSIDRFRNPNFSVNTTNSDINYWNDATDRFYPGKLGKIRFYDTAINQQNI